MSERRLISAPKSSLIESLMSVVFDEVIGTVAPEPMPREDAHDEESSETHQAVDVRAEIRKLEQRMARLRAN